MPFLALNGQTFRVQSNGIGQKYNEHGVDRFRTFDGAMRVTRRGIYREWNGNTAILSYADAATLIALLSPGATLALTGDLVGAEEVAVMPILISNDPINTATGPKRRVVFTLHETPSPLPADTSAVPYLFCQRGTGFYSDDAATVPSGAGGRVAVWYDQTGNGRHLVLTTGMNHVSRPSVNGDAVQFGINADATPGYLRIPDLGLGEAEIMLSLRAEADPPIDDTAAQLFAFGNSGAGATIYPTESGHILDSFGSNGVHDLGAIADDLTEWNVFNVGSSGTNGYVARLNNAVLLTVSNVDYVFGIGGTVQLGQISGGGYWTGQIRDFVVFPAFLTAAQRRSWYDYMSGATDDPPFEP